MLKNERLQTILDLVNQHGSIKVSDIVNRLNVSDMTIRRDLQELEEDGALKRVHGCAISLQSYPVKELSHDDKEIINLDQKKSIAMHAVNYVEPGDTIFIGPGTTMALFAEHLNTKDIRVVTNCWPVFKKLSDKQIEAILLGGKMRSTSQAFIGDITNMVLDNMRFNKIFISANGVVDGKIMTSTMEEARTQQLALNNSVEKYLLIDDTKINRRDFISFYEIADLTAVVINKDIHNKHLELEDKVPIIKA